MKSTKQQSIIALKKARTHLDTVIDMIEKEEDCFSILQQIKAVIGMIRFAQQMSLKNYLERCLSPENKEMRNDLAEEISTVVNLLNK